MYIYYDDNTYNRIYNLSFSPEADLTLSSIPVNQFQVDIETTDSFDIGVQIKLYDDRDNLWAQYVISQTKRLSDSIVRITAQSEIALLDRWEVPAEMYISMLMSDVIYHITHDLPAAGAMTFGVDIELGDYYRDPHRVEPTVTGFCPQQTARERLQWLCLTVGAIIQQWEGGLKIIPCPDVDLSAIDAKGTLIPIGDTYWKPDVTMKEKVQKLTISAYENYDNVEDPDRDQESAVDGQGVTWYYEKVELYYDNPDYQSEYGREVTIDGVTLIHAVYSPTTLSRLARAYFRRLEIQFEAINNGQYWPGDKVRVYTDDSTVYEGYVKSCSFSFGLQSKAQMVVSVSGEVDMARLNVNYLYSITDQGETHTVKLGQSSYYLPSDEPYSITPPKLTVPNGSGADEYIPDVDSVDGEFYYDEMNVTVTYSHFQRNDVRLIKVDTPPTKLTYRDGESIDLTGIVVRAYDREGNLADVYIDGGERGVIPANRLTLATPYAVYNATGKQDIYLGYIYGNSAFNTTYTITVTT